MTDPITAAEIGLTARGNILPRHTGRHFLAFENLVYDLMGRASSDYQGGLWQFFELSNGGFFMAPDRSEPMWLSWPDNYFEGQISPQAAGIGITLMALSILSFNDWLSDEDRDRLTDRFHKLRDFAAEHAEAREIFGLID